MTNINPENCTKQILVCDDIEEMVQILKITLESQGYQVETTNSGLEAISKIQTNQPDLFITNLMMPDMTGWDVINYVTQNLKLTTLPILVVSATKQEDLLKDEVAGFLCKPVKFDEFVAKVKSILEVS